jgi:hypothetical protein
MNNMAFDIACSMENRSTALFDENFDTIDMAIRDINQYINSQP